MSSPGHPAQNHWQDQRAGERISRWGNRANLEIAELWEGLTRSTFCNSPEAVRAAKAAVDLIESISLMINARAKIQSVRGCP